MRLVFDLDGTLLDTRTANLIAYRKVGVEPPPESAHLPARMWIKDSKLHAAKLAVYPEMLEAYGRELPTADIFKATGGTILTGASSTSVQAAIKVFPWLGLADDFIWEQSPDDKIIELISMGRTGLYFDDNPKFVARVREDTQWQAIDVSGW